MSYRQTTYDIKTINWLTSRKEHTEIFNICRWLTSCLLNILMSFFYVYIIYSSLCLDPIDDQMLTKGS